MSELLSECPNKCMCRVFTCNAEILLVVLRSNSDSLFSSEGILDISQGVHVPWLNVLSVSHGEFAAI